MGTFSIWHWLIVGLVVLLLFGRGKISELMGDVAKGIKAFKKGMAEDNDPNAPPKTTAVDPPPHAPPHGVIPGKPVEQPRPFETPRA